MESLFYSQYYYRIRDKVNGKFYSGAKWGHDAYPELFWKKGGYFTSSKSVLDLIKEYGSDRFEVIKVVPMKDAFSYESRFLKKIDAENHPLFINENNNNLKNTKLKCHYCNKMFASQNFSRHLYKCSAGVEGIKANKSRRGIVLVKRKGTLRGITNGVEDKRIKVDDKIPKGWWLGSTRKGTKYNVKEKEVKICITDGKTTLKIPHSALIPDGWYKGRHYNTRKMK